ncbi:MAG: hypothetical protein ACAH17_01265 [Candidatus Paceibacterota bacterium]
MTAVYAALISGLPSKAAEVTVPDTGFASSAYTNCYNAGRTAADPKGNFGSYSIAAVQYPTTATSANSTCYVPKSASEAILPAGKTGFTALAARSIIIPTTTGGTGNIGTLTERAWRNSSTNTCIIGTRVTMINTDHDSTTPGTQYFEINDLARGGFSGATGDTLKVYYTIFTSPVNQTAPVFRVGRTFTSVQHRALKYDTNPNRALNGINYLDLPTKNSFTGEINGESTPITALTMASTTAVKQDAAVNSNYVDFTFNAVEQDPDGTSSKISAFVYIEAPCASNPTVQANAIRLRQTAQENTTPKSIDLPGYAIGTP